MKAKAELLRARRVDFYTRAVFAALFHPKGFSLKDVGAPVSERTKRRLVLDLERAGFAARTGMKGLGRWMVCRGLTELAALHIVENPKAVLDLCDVALKLCPGDDTRAGLLGRMVSELKCGYMLAMENPMPNAYGG